MNIEKKNLNIEEDIVIKRYTPKDIGSVWTDETKFRTWLQVELAVIQVRCEQGEYPSDIYDRIKAQARFVVKEIIELDKKIEHDMLAFIENVRSYLDEDFRKYFHDGLTSYDIEVPAQALTMGRASVFVMEDLSNLITQVRVFASQHMWTYRIAMSHGKDAKPSCLGWLACSYLDALELARTNLSIAFEQINMAKCSGAVGNYMTITPEFEEAVLDKLGLRVRPAATQITMRDVFANLLSQISTLGGVMEKIALDMRLMATSRFAEITEPRKTDQKGSSAMPHKRNPIILERLSGMPAVLRGYAAAGQELIRTWLERDIAHSSMERILLPDATILVDYILRKFTWIFQGLIVHREQMVANIEDSFGLWASEDVKLLLCGKGYDTEAVYSFVQGCAFKAEDEKRPFRDVLLETEFSLAENRKLGDVIGSDELDTCFDFVSKLNNLSTAYARFNLDPQLALPSNISIE